MRLLPDSIAGRTVLVLVAGLALTLIASIGVLIALDRLLDRHWIRYPQLLQRIATITTVVNQLPASARPDLVANLSEQQLHVSWSPERDARAQPAQDWRTRHLLEDLRRLLDGAVGPSTLSVDQTADKVLLWARLDDGSWLEFDFPRDWFGPFWFLRFVIALVVLTGGIAFLAVWAARRVTVPLAHFTGAAARLGTDVGAPRLNEAGPSELREAARAFNLMQDRIRRLVDDRTQMLAAITHDLRTFLTRLRLRAEFIDDAEQKAKAIADLEAMRAMLDETLAFARDDAGEKARVEVDLAALVQSLCADFADAGQPVRYEGPDHVVAPCRPVAIKRALANLIDNAVRYAGEAEVDLKATPDAVEIDIADRGPGIPIEQRNEVFRPFYRLEPSRSRATGGTGLGLAVARASVRRHGGEIALDDRAGGGLVARVILPLDARSRRS